MSQPGGGGGGGGGEGDLAPTLPGCVVTKWRDMGLFLASREWDSVHQYGYVLKGMALLWVKF